MEPLLSNVLSRPFWVLLCGLEWVWGWGRGLGRAVGPCSEFSLGKLCTWTCVRDAWVPCHARFLCSIQSVLQGVRQLNLGIRALVSFRTDTRELPSAPLVRMSFSLPRAWVQSPSQGTKIPQATCRSQKKKNLPPWAVRPSCLMFASFPFFSYPSTRTPMQVSPGTYWWWKVPQKGSWTAAAPSSSMARSSPWTRSWRTLFRMPTWSWVASESVCWVRW